MQSGYLKVFKVTELVFNIFFLFRKIHKANQEIKVLISNALYSIGANEGAWEGLALPIF